jgi:hypothetical protein
MERSVDRRIHDRHQADLQVRVTAVDNPELSASGQACDISPSSISVYLPLQIEAGSAVRLTINDRVLFGFVVRSEPERSYFRTGIDVVQVLLGGSDLSQLLEFTVEKFISEAQPSETLP